MAKVKSPHMKVGNTPAKKKSKSLVSPKLKTVYCVLCRRSYLKQDTQAHIHGMLHHRELETVLGKNSCHECQACQETPMRLNEYAQHISTDQHKAKLNSLVSRNVKPPSLNETLGPQIMSQITKRNKTLKSRAKKEMRKKKKKLKQLAGQKCSEKVQQAAKRNTVMSKVVKPENSKQVNKKLQKQMQDTYKEGTKNAVVQNKENKVSCRGPAGQTWQHPYVWDQFNQYTHQQKSGNNFSGNSHCSRVKFDFSRIDRSFRRPHNTQGSATNMPDQTAWRAISQHAHPNRQYGASEFTSDHLPQNGAIIFDHSLNKSTGSSQPRQESSNCLGPPASANAFANAARIREDNVGAMLRQIRRALGVREPCRADRDAQRQDSEAGVRLADQARAKKAKPAGGSFRNCAKEAAHRITSAATTSVQSSPVSSLVPTSHSCVRPSNIAPPQPKHTAVKKMQGIPQHCKKSSVVASDTNGPPNGKERESQGGLDSFSRTPSDEPHVNISRKVRIAHKPGKCQEAKEAGFKPTVNKLLSSSAARSQLSCREVYEDVTRKKQDRVKGTPRFGIELVNTLSDKDHSTQAEDLPLSEGFHWESLPHSPPDAHWNGSPPQPQDTTCNESHTETQSESQMQESLEPPGAAQEACSGQMVKAVSVKVEPNLEDGNGDVRDHSSARKKKRKVDTHEDISDKYPRGKRMKTKSNKDQDQMDQLLAVSLREEELSHSLNDLDKSLIQARNTLQAAYTEVQRLLLLRQQCTAEVNGMRAKRIEILQGMQGGYSGEFNGAERAATSSAGAAAVAQSRLSPLPSSSTFPTSSSQQLPHTNPAPSISQPHPTTLSLPTTSVKREICQAPTLLCHPETPPTPVNQPVHPLPSDLFPPLLPTSRLAAPTTSVDSLKQLQTDCSTSVSASPESSARQQEHVTWEGLKDCGKSVRLIGEEADSDSEGDDIQAAAEKPVSTVVPEINQNASAAATDNDGGSESDDSVKVMEPSSFVVIDNDESDIEETVSNVPVHQEPPQKSVCEFKSANTQTCQQNDAERKPILVPSMDAAVPPECADVVEDDEPSLGVFENHQGPVLGLQVHKGLLYTCSGDNTARAYSLMSRECQAVFKGHTNKINCLLVSPPPNMPVRLFTGSNDQTIRCYSVKTQKCLEEISLPDRVLCLHIAWNILFAGLANGSVASHDLKTLKQLDVFECHGPRAVSCLGTAQEGARRVLLVGSYDSIISVRDAKSGLLLRSLEGHTKAVLCMKVVNDLVFSGSSDMSVHAHNIHTGELVRIYKGHGHAVTSVVILGKVMVTACLDKLVRVYELQSHDRLQVYGGHSDMVICMAVHKSVIYTGCHDGRIQAVKLNLMKNYRCWWQNCSLVFGMGEHLVQHLLKDHTKRNLTTAKCCWRGCSAFFAKLQSVRKKLPEHMQTHVENDSKVQADEAQVL